MQELSIILVVQLMAGAMLGFLYATKPPRERANLWRKLSCYAGARATGIETTESNYTRYKAEMGLQETT